MCENDLQAVQNCGFVRWVDEEWPATCKRAVGKLWRMYEDICTAKGNDRITNSRLLKEASDEKNMWEQKYHNCVAQLNKMNLLETQVTELQNVQRCLADEKLNLEYKFYHVLKMNEENKEKLERVKAIVN